MAAAPLPTLSYAPRPPWLRRRAFRRAVAGGILLILALAGVRWGPATYQRARLLYWQRQCLRYSPPAGQVVYEQDPTGGSPLLKRGAPYAALPGGSSGRFRSPVVGLTPDCATRYLQLLATPPSSSGAVLFMHERTTPSGTRCLVLVTSDFAPDSDPQFIAGYDVMPAVVRPATWRAAAVPCSAGYAIDVLSGIRSTPMHLRVFAGQADPADPSHFTIRYELDGHPAKADGFVRDVTPGWIAVEFRKERN